MTEMRLIGRRLGSRASRGQVREAGAQSRRIGPLRVAGFLIGFGLALTATLSAAIGVFAYRLGPPPLETARAQSVVVVDRNQRLLRAFTTADGRWRLPVEMADVDQRYLAMLGAFEDKRFDTHFGVDPAATLRAAAQALWYRRWVSGSSTLTMQVARLLEGEHARTATGKLRQMIRATQIERELNKREILSLYLKLAPFGGNIEGVRAASLAYFGKEPRRLSVGEAALLVALPQSPENRRPDRHAVAAERARNRVLDRVAAAGVITVAEAVRAKTERVPTLRREFPKLSPHLTEAEVARGQNRPVHRLTLDRDLQASLEGLARERVRGLGPQLSAAVLVADHRTGEILAHVGSSDYMDTSRLGSVDMVTAVRSPGSTLKPLIYGLGFEAGIIHPETLIEDRQTRFGTYTPKNFDDEFHGTVSIRDALAQSLNIPAVKVLSEVGPGRMLGRFRRIGLDPQLPGKDAEPTVAIALGGLGLKLRELTELYAAIARGGEPVSLSHHWRAPTIAGARHDPRISDRRLLSPVAAWYVGDILKDAPPPAHARAGRLAYKTGTSYGYRDAWAIGYDGAHTIAVWVGRADGSATPGLTGRTAAAPILFDAFQRVSPDRTVLPSAPAGAIRSTGADLPPNLKRFRDANEQETAGAYLELPVAIAFPPDRAEVEIATMDDALVLKAENGALPLTWLVDGTPIGSEPHRRDVAWQPEGRGFAKVTVIDAKGRIDRVTVRVK